MDVSSIWSATNNTFLVAGQEKKSNSDNRAAIRMRTIEARLKSFRKKKNPYKYGTYYQFALAGFFLVDENTVKCFSCKYQFKNWPSYVYPMETHVYICHSFCNFIKKKINPFLIRNLIAKALYRNPICDRETRTVDFGSTVCKICFDVPMNIVLMPCRHLLTCQNCAKNCKVCPLCSQPINSNIKIFLA